MLRELEFEVNEKGILHKVAKNKTDTSVYTYIGSLKIP